MSFTWDKQGLVFEPAGRFPWMLHYAQNPNALLYEDKVRVFFNCRPAPGADSNVTAHIGFVDLARDDLSRILGVSSRPLLPLGELGAFDQFGTMSSSTVWHGQEVWNYYVGWTCCQAVPYNWAIGVARSHDGGETFSRLGRGPVLGPSLHEPFLQNAPFVKKIGDTWHAWYSSGIAWLEHEGKLESVYQIMHATSDNGLTWNRESKPILPPRVKQECQTSATVIQAQGRYHMWFSWRHALDFRNASRGYRLGYAWSQDLATWHRDDGLAGLEMSPEGWDSEMVCYPHVLDLEGQLIMFYCGNQFGRDGFGYALGRPTVPS